MNWTEFVEAMWHLKGQGYWNGVAADFAVAICDEMERRKAEAATSTPTPTESESE